MKSVLKARHQFVTLLLVASLLTVSAWGADFTFTAIPDQDTTRLQERFGKIANYLSEELGITGEVHTCEILQRIGSGVQE